MMDFLGETAKDDFKPGDSSFLAEASKDQKAQTYEPSDVPGFLNPIVDGKPDTSQYITADDAEQATQSGIEPVGVPREQAIAQIAKNDGIQNPTDKEAEAALAKKKKGKTPESKQETRFDYPM
jgi:hypothetical protein